MGEIDTTQFAALLGYARKYFVDHVMKYGGLPPPSQNIPRKMRWRYADAMAYKAGQRWSTGASQYRPQIRGNTSSQADSGLGAR